MSNIHSPAVRLFSGRVVLGLLTSALFLAMPCRSIRADSLLKEGEPQIQAVSGAQSFGQTPPLASLVKELSPAVVNISVEAEAQDEAADMPMEGFPFFKKEIDRPFRSLGSGFIVHQDGYIVTSNHVIDKSDKIIIRLLDDKTEYPATVVGKDAKTDLALLKIDPKTQLKTVFLGDSDIVDVGEWVIAIGNQFQLGQTVTAGIVSAKSRRVPSKASGPYDSFIQTDASINPGSSGGPLFNVKGQVIGINTAIFSPGRAQLGGTGFNIGIGFAVPVNVLKSIIDQLKNQGKVTRGLLGVKIQPIDLDIAKALDLQSQDGALVAEVMKDTPASAAGFKQLDVIVKYEGHPIKEYEDLPLMVANTKVGSDVEIEVIRQGKPKALKARIDELHEEAIEQPKVETQKANEIGLIVEEVTEAQAKALDLPKAAGVFVAGVQNGSVADKAGILRGDVLEELGGHTLDNLQTLSKLLKALPKDKPTVVIVRRKDGSRVLTLKVK